MLNIYIANLGKYNEGQLVGEWLELPCTNEEIEALLRRIGIYEGSRFEETAIHDYETDIPGLKIEEGDNIIELSNLAEQIENLDWQGLVVLQAYMKNGASIEKALEKVEEGEYTVYENCEDMEDVARDIIGTLSESINVPEPFDSYFDYESYGNDLETDGLFYFIDDCCVEIH